MTPTIKFNCAICGAEKTMKKHLYEFKIRENGVAPTYCSKACAYVGRKQKTERRKAA